MTFAQAATSSVVYRQLIGQSFTIDLPSGYQEIIGPQSPDFAMVGFVGPQRQDGTRGLIQITFASLSKLREKTGISSVEEFGSFMISGVKRRRQQWKVEVTDRQFGNMAVKRYSWSGVVFHQDKGDQMFGVMYVGIKGNTAFSLHTQDLEQHANQAIPRGEQSMQTFRLVLPSPP
jgi:hypothetical protein